MSEVLRERDVADGGSRSLLLIEPVGAAAVRIRWSVSAAAWARLDAEFPASAGATEPVLRLRLIRHDGCVAEVATERLADPATASGGAIVVAPADDGDYEAELGLATADGGWLVLMRSARQRWSRLEGNAQAAGATDPDAVAEVPQRPPAPSSASVSAPVAEAAAAGASPFHPPAWGLLPADMGGPSPAPYRLAVDVAADQDAAAPLPPGWGEGPAAAGYEAAPGGPVGVQIRAEVMVYGSAPPGTLIDLHGRALRVGPGGAFSLRFDLTDPELLRRALAEAPRIAPEATVEPGEAD